MVDTNHAPEKLKGAMYTLSGKVDGSAIYIVEDSEIDLGLIASVERNLKRYFEIITEVLMWHEQKMAENPKKKANRRTMRLRLRRKPEKKRKLRRKPGESREREQEIPRKNKEKIKEILGKDHCGI